MARQLSVAVRNAKADSYEVTIGVSALLCIFTGAQPANCAAADSGTKLAEFILPADWLSAASAGAKTKVGTWTIEGIAAGTAGHYRIKDSTGTTCHDQGSITVTGGGGLMTVSNTAVAVGRTLTVDTFVSTEGNA